MFINYLKTVFRNISRQKGYTTINLIGLAFGLTCVLLILLWIQDELGFDRFHYNAKDIYRIILSDQTYQPEKNYPVTPPALAVALKKDFPEIIASAKFYDRGFTLISNGDRKFKETISYTDPTIFDIFTMEFLKGTPVKALSSPFSMVISESMGRKFFGEENPLGKTLTVDNNFVFKITGIIRDFPDNSSLHADFIISFEHLKILSGKIAPDSWREWCVSTFVLLSHQADIAALNQKISDYALKHEDYTWQPVLKLQPFTDIHLNDINGGGIIVYVFIFGIIAVFILLIACINFMNLATARSALRAREIGVRKVVGATRKNLIQQFYGESLMLSCIALCFCLLLTELLLPVFNNLSGKTLVLNFKSNPLLIPLLVLITIFTGLVAGSYPALYLSSIQPIKALKGSKLSGSSFFRKALVVFQFTLSVLLIFSTLVVSKQVVFINNQYLGFNKEQVLYTPLNNELNEKYKLVKDELERLPEIYSVCATSGYLGIRSIGSFDINRWDGNNGEKSILSNIICSSDDFLETFGIQMADGRYFSQSFSSDTNAVILNETAVREMGLENPIGISILDHYKVIGVIKDFNFESLKSTIKPLTIFLDPRDYSYLAIKINASNTAATLRYIEKITTQLSPNYPFEYQFLDEQFDKMYKSEQQLGQIFNYFTILAIIISCLGLIGLASFMAQRRTKEIGVRKVLGSSIPSIIVLLSGDFTKLIVISNIIAWPVAWLAMNNWLQNFAYKTPISWWIFAVSGVISLLIGLLSVIFQAVKAATINPVRSLRYE